MLSKVGCMNRRQHLWEALPKETQWVLITDPRHVNYLCGFWVNPLSNSAGDRGFLFLDRDGESVLICDAFALSSAIGEPYVDRKVVEPWYGNGPAVPNRDHALFGALDRFTKTHRPCLGAVETEWFPSAAVAALGPLSLREDSPDESLGSILRDSRRCKDSDEMDLLKRCFRAGEAGHRRAREVIEPGISEMDVYREVQSAALAELGAIGLVYGDFRATSPTLPNAGGPPTAHKLEDGETFILDYSVVLAGYRGDFTNSIAVGKVSSGQRRLMDECRAALASGERALRPGVTGAAVYHAVNAPLAAAGWPLRFHAGHGLGLSHPEAPAFVAASKEIVRKGEVVTLEPGAYVEGIGGVRIEHNYLITHDGYERLTNHAIEL